MSVHYKFNAAKEFDTLPVDGLHISLSDLKEAIVHHKRLGRGDLCDLQVTNAETKEVYTDEKSLIPKNSSLIIARIPIDPAHKKLGDLSRDDKELLLSNPEYRMNTEGAEEADQLSRRLEEVPDLTRFAGSEDEKISAMIAQSTIDFHPSRYLKLRNTVMHGKVPPFYKCYKCHQGGHWVNNCPLNNQDLRKSTGIPSKFLMEVNDPNTPGVMITANGKYVIFRQSLVMSDARAIVKGPLPSDPPTELKCLICKDIMKDAVLVPCCTAAFCDDCIRNHLLDSDDHVCPECHKKDVGPDTLIPNRYLRVKVQQFGHQFFTELPPPQELDIVSRSPSPAVKEILSRSVSPTFVHSPRGSAGTPEIKFRSQSDLMENSPNNGDVTEEKKESRFNRLESNGFEPSSTDSSSLSSPLRTVTTKEILPASPIEIFVKDTTPSSPRLRGNIVKDAVVTSMSPIEHLVKDAMSSPPLEIISPFDDEIISLSKSKRHTKKNKKKQKENDEEGKDKKHHKKKDKEKKKKSKRKDSKDEETKAEELEQLNTSLLLNEAICPTFDPSVPPPVNILLAPSGYLPPSNPVPQYPAQYGTHNMVDHRLPTLQNYSVPALENNDPLATFTRYLMEKDERKRKKLSRSPSRTPPYRGRSLTRSRSRSRLKQRSRSRSVSKPRSPSRRAKLPGSERSPSRRMRLSPPSIHHSYHSPSSRDRSLTLSRTPSPNRHFKPLEPLQHYPQNHFSPQRIEKVPGLGLPGYPVMNHVAPMQFPNNYDYSSYQYNQASYEGYGANFYDSRGRGFLRSRGRRGFPYESHDNRGHIRGAGNFPIDQLRHGGKAGFDPRRVDDRRPVDEIRVKERFTCREEEDEWRRRKEQEEEWERRNLDKRMKEHRHHMDDKRRSPNYKRESSLERYSRSKRSSSPRDYEHEKYPKRKIIDVKERRLDSRGRVRSRERYDDERRSRSSSSIPRERRHSPQKDMERDRKLTPIHSADYENDRRRSRDHDRLRKDEKRYKRTDLEKIDKVVLKEHVRRDREPISDVKSRISEHIDSRRDKKRNENKSEEANRNIRLENKEEKIQSKILPENEEKTLKETSKISEELTKDLTTSKIDKEKKKHDKKKKKKEKRRASQNSEGGVVLEDDDKKKKKKERKKHKHTAGPDDDLQNEETTGHPDSPSIHEPMEVLEEQKKRQAAELAAVAAYLPELSKWERDEEEVVGSPLKLNKRIESTSKEEPSLVTSDVLKRAENALFSKDTAIRNRPLNSKKKDSELETREAKKKGSSIQITISSKNESQIGRIKVLKSDSVAESIDVEKITNTPELESEKDLSISNCDDIARGKKRDHSVGKEQLKSKKPKFQVKKSSENDGILYNDVNFTAEISKVKENSPGLSDTREHMLKVAEASSSVKDDNLAPNVYNKSLKPVSPIESNDDQTVTSSEEAKILNKVVNPLLSPPSGFDNKAIANVHFICSSHDNESVTQSVAVSHIPTINSAVLESHSTIDRIEDNELEEGELIETSSKEEELPDSTVDQKTDIEPPLSILRKGPVRDHELEISKVEKLDPLYIDRAIDELGPGLNIHSLEPPPPFLQRTIDASLIKVIKDKKAKKKKKKRDSSTSSSSSSSSSSSEGSDDGDVIKKKKKKRRKKKKYQSSDSSDTEILSQKKKRKGRDKKKKKKKDKKKKN